MFIFLNFGKWSASQGNFLFCDRIYIRGRWTPFIKCHRRSSFLQPTNPQPPPIPVCVTTTAVFLDDVRDDGSIEGYPIMTFFFPLESISFLPDFDTVCITGEGFQRVQLRLSAIDFIKAAEVIQTMRNAKGDKN